MEIQTKTAFVQFAYVLFSRAFVFVENILFMDFVFICCTVQMNSLA